MQTYLTSKVYFRRFRFGDAIGARVGRGRVHAALRIVHHGLSASHQRGVLLARGEVVPLITQCLQDLGLNPRLDHNVTTYRIVRDGESGRFDRGLDIHAVVHKVGDKLRVGQRLVWTTHDAKADVQVALLHKSWNDRVKWPLARLQRVGMAGIEHEQRSPVLQREAHSADHNAGTEAAVVAWINDAMLPSLSTAARYM